MNFPDTVVIKQVVKDTTYDTITNEQETTVSGQYLDQYNLKYDKQFKDIEFEGVFFIFEFPIKIGDYIKKEGGEFMEVKKVLDFTKYVSQHMEVYV